LEDRLNLPTVKELHLVGSKDLPFSMLDRCKTLKRLSLSGPFEAEGQVCASTLSTLPQLKSLSLYSKSVSSSLLAWLRLHINELEALDYLLSSELALSQLFEVCSETLKDLDLDLVDTACKIQFLF
jgi:hypothetical protein